MRPPDPEADGLRRWDQMMHWCIKIMKIDDPDLGFVSSLLYQAIEKVGLTDRQAKWAKRIFDKFEARYRAGDFDE